MKRELFVPAASTVEETIAQLPVTVTHVENRDCAMEFVLQMGRLIFFRVLS